MTVAERVTVTVNLEAGCVSDGCAEFAGKLYQQLGASNRYVWPCSLLKLPDTIDEWAARHRTARRRANRAALTFQFAEIKREHYPDDIYAINTSVDERQGRPMSDSYRERPTLTPLPGYPCERHRIYTYGILDPGGRLRAYTWVYRCGGLVMFSQILGHHDYLDQHVMYLLVRGVLSDQIRYGPGVAFYNRHDSGTDGLRFFKERCGFQPARVDWRVA